MKPRFVPLLLGLFLVSGAVALVYQSLWTRQLSLILGSTTYAVGTVLAAFMAGLGAGAWVLGRRADRTPEPLRLYAGLEAAIGVFGLVSPVLLAQGNGLYAACYARFADRPAALTAARFAIGFLLVAAPAFLMGGTLPVAVRYVVRRAEGLGRAVGLLYALNTLGGALGVLLLPFVLLPRLGMRVALFACGAVNLAIALAAFLASRRARDTAPVSATVAAGPVPAPGGVLPAFFLSGFVALALEAVWNRFFAMYFGSSIYSYAVILCLYLVGIVAGGMVFGRLERRGLPPVRVFAACLLLLVADLAVTVPLMDRILYVQLAALDVLGLGFTAFQLANVAAACLVILPPTILFGVSFPAVAAAASRGVERLGSELGFVYLVNTAGTTAGALVASFLLIPGLGVRGSLDLLVGVAAAALVVTAPRFRVAAVALGLAVLPVVTAWDLRLMHTLVSKEPGIVLRIWRDGGLGRTLDAINVLEARDGVDATVSVAEYYGRSRSLLVNGKPDASADKDLLTQAMLGHLPLLLHPSPREALVVGMGSGVTLAAVARHPVATIDLVEISAEVLDLGDRYFREVNRGALHDPRVAVHVEDGRNFIAFTPGRTYDVIVSEPSNPWMTGVSNLFTAEYFAQVRQRLRPGGILCQWFHYYSMTLADVRTLIGTLRGQFSHVYAFAYQESGASGDLVLLASEAALDFAPVLAAIGGAGPAGPDLRALGLHEPEQLLDALMLSPENVDRFVAGAPVNSDDVPRIELRAPRAIFEDTALANLRAFLTASGGARLPVRPEGPAEGPFRLGGLEVVPPPGFHLRSSGIRIETGAPDADGLVARDAVREITLEASGGRRLAALGAPAMLDRAGLDRLAALASGAPAVFDGAATTAGHPALRYRSGTPPGVVLVWSCPETAASYAVSVSAGPEAATEATGARCHHP